MMKHSLRRALALVAGLLCLSLLGACSPLPKDWPIKELTLPEGATPGAVPRKLKTLREVLNHIKEVGDRIPLAPRYEVAFNSSASWDSMVQSVNSQLSPLGYKEWKPSDMQTADAETEGAAGGQKFSAVVHLWEKDDKSMLVFLFNTSQLTSAGDPIDREGDYILGIHVR
jgi:hypothetical protein